MHKAFSVALSTQLSLLRRLETIASNIANQSTVGHRAEDVTFSSAISSAGRDPVTFSSAGKSFTNLRPGELTRTGNPLDVAISGDAWLSLRTPSGIAVTRDGRMRIAPSGELQSVTGHPVLDVGGSPIQLSPQGGPPTFARDGTITQDGKQVGIVGIYLLPPDARMSRMGDAAFLPGTAPVPSLDANGPALIQGHVERSNVDPMRELTRLIEVQRRFDAVSAMGAHLESTFSDTIRTLGGS